MVAQSVAAILADHVRLSVECIDRMYLNVYVPKLQRDNDVAWFFRGHRRQPFASTALMTPMSRRFVVVQFRPGERKDDVMAERLKRFDDAEGVVFIGKAQEKAPVFRTVKRRSPNGQSYPWIVRSTAMVNQYYIYVVDRDFGPFFLKFSSYFPYNAKLCLNGHEYAKRQLAKAGIAFRGEMPGEDGGEARAQQAIVGSAEEESDAPAEIGDVISVGVRSALDHAVEAQAAQLIGDGAGAEGVGRTAPQLDQVLAQIGAAKAVGEQAERQEGVPEVMHLGIGEAQA
jgi:hypothetical protein